MSDQTVVGAFLDQLIRAELGPSTLFADMGYGSGANLVASASRGVDLQAPVRDPHASAKRDRVGEPVEPMRLTEEPEEPVESKTKGQAEWSGGGTAGESVDVSTSEADGVPAVPPLSIGDFTFEEGFTGISRCPGEEEPGAQHRKGAGTRLWATFSPARCEGCSLAGRCPTTRRGDGRRTLQTSVAGAAPQVRQ